MDGFLQENVENFAPFNEIWFLNVMANFSAIELEALCVPFRHLSCHHMILKITIFTFLTRVN